ncbi:MAG: hypothetical protein Q4B88_03590 [Moraxella sp.]|nr:hypothetical protein [Moraxella sp.]
MPHHRYHVHMICDNSDQSIHALHDALVIFFENKAHVTRDLSTVSPETASYSWRCINRCDFVFVLLGNQYGKLNNTGVSQLHISYLNAKTKNKPLFVFIHNDKNSTERSRQLNDLITLISEQNQNIQHINASTNLPVLLDVLYHTLVHESLKEKDTADDVAYLEEPKIHTDVPVEAIKTDTKADILQLKPELSADKHSLHEPSDRLTEERHTSSKNNPLKDTESKHAFSREKVSTRQQQEMLGSCSKTTPALHEEITLNCTAHAFRGGALIEAVFMATVTWYDILISLRHVGTAFSSQRFWRALNELIQAQAMPAVKLSDPEVHAISRCQVTKADMLWVQETLEQAGWMIKIEAHGSKELWQLGKMGHGTAHQRSAL